MGRISGLSSASPSFATAEDLFRFSGTGVRTWTTTAAIFRSTTARRTSPTSTTRAAAATWRLATARPDTNDAADAFTYPGVTGVLLQHRSDGFGCRSAGAAPDPDMAAASWSRRRRAPTSVGHPRAGQPDPAARWAPGGRSAYAAGADPERGVVRAAVPPRPEAHRRTGARSRPGRTDRAGQGSRSNTSVIPSRRAMSRLP